MPSLEETTSDPLLPLPPTVPGLGQGTSARESLWSRPFVLLLVVTALFFFGFQLLLVTVPVLAARLGGGNTSAGLVMGAFTLAAMVVRPVTGWVLDAYGRKAIFLVGTALCAAVILAHELVAGVFLLLVLRFFHGAGFGLATTAGGTLASDLVPRSRLGEGMGVFTMAMSLPLAVAPAVGLALTSSGDFTVLFLSAAGLTVLSLLLALRMPYPLRQRSGVRMRLSALVERSSLFPAGVLFLLTATYGPLIAFIALYGEERGIANVGPFFTVFAATLVVARPLSGRVADRFGYQQTATAGAVMMAVALVLLAGADALGMLLAAGVAYGLGLGTAQPSLQALVIHRVSPARRGAATAAFFTAYDMGMAVGSFGGGFLAATLALDQVYLLSAAAPLAAATILVIAMVRGRGDRSART